jgi:16S rRNA (guanine966-N2)-methyltransferase
VRVIRGTARGRQLRPVPGEITRPITDRVKEALFNIIGADIQGASLLDLFAGTGSVGIEALSVGAGLVRFVDIHRSAVQTVQTNLVHTRLERNAEVWHRNALTLISSPPDRNFDYIYIAPPQYQDIWAEVILALEAHPDWLSDDGWAVVQIDPKEFHPLPLKNLEEFDRRRYGDTILVFYQRVESERQPDM